MADEFVIRQREAGDIVTGLSLGDADFAPLKTYLRRNAKSHQEQSLARTYVVLAHDTKVIAYLTLVCGEVVADRDDEDIALDAGVYFPYPQFPAVKIARLAVDARFAGRGIGKELVELAIGVTRDKICPTVGCRFLVVDAKAKSVDFYLRCGFTLIDTEENRRRASPVMFIDMHKV